MHHYASVVQVLALERATRNRKNIQLNRIKPITQVLQRLQLQVGRMKLELASNIR